MPAPSGEKWLELRQDFLVDPVVDRQESLSKHGCLLLGPATFSLIDRYINRDIAIHVHLAFHRVGDRETTKLCATFYRPTVHPNGRDIGMTGSIRGGEDGGSDEVQTAVLVDVVEQSQDFKNVGLGILSHLPCLKRLQVSDDVFCLVGNPLQYPFALGRLSVVIDIGGEDGELHTQTLMPSIGEPRKLTDEVIQSGTAVVENFPYQDSELRRRLFHDLDVEIEGPKVRVELMEKAMICLFQVPENLALQGVEVFLRPIQLEANSIQARTTHGA